MLREFLITIGIIAGLWLGFLTLAYFRPRVWHVLLGSDDEKPDKK